MHDGAGIRFLTWGSSELPGWRDKSSDGTKPNQELNMADDNSVDVLTLTAEIVSSYVGNASHLNANDIPSIIKSVRAALSEGETPQNEEGEPEVSAATRSQIKKSIGDDALISFVDGKPYKTLKRHLARHGMDMNAYRKRYGLPNDYPSVAPSYSAARSEMAKRLGLGARGKAAKEAPAKGGRKAPTKAATAASE